MHDDSPTLPAFDTTSRAEKPEDGPLSSGSSDVERQSKEEQDGDDGKPHYPVWQWVLTLIGLYTGALLYGLDTTIAADVQQPVYERFGNIEDLAWIGLGFPMGSVAGIMFIGRLYDLYNIKWLMNASIFIFEVGSAVCGAAPNMNALIVGRVIAGLGGCGMYIGALNFVSALGSTKKLPLYNALIGVCWGTGAILGPVIGGAFSTSSATWRWAFYINLPLAALLSPVYFFVTPSWSPKPDVSFQEKFVGIDWLGVFLNAGVLTFLITVITFAGGRFAWDSSVVIALWVVWGVFLLAFIAQQRLTLFTTKARRLFPVHFLRSRDMILLFIATACAATANAVTLYFIPIFFGFTRGDSPLKAAVRLLPFIVVFIFFVMFSGASLPIVGRYAPYYTIGGVLILAGSAAMFKIDSTTSVANIYGFEVLIASGSGICFQNAYAVASAKVEEVDKSNAIGFINTGQIGTTALSLAIAGCLYQNLGVQFLRNALSSSGLSEAMLRATLGGAASSTLGSTPPEVAQKAIETVAYTISRVFGMNIAAGALLLVASLLMKQEKMDLSKAVAGGG